VTYFADLRGSLGKKGRSGRARRLSPTTAPGARKHAVFWPGKAIRTWGKVTIFRGWHYREYVRGTRMTD
jgi:hypothetical protein